MSLSREAFDNAGKQAVTLNDRVNKLFKKLGLPPENKIQMNHYGMMYLFGKLVTGNTTDDALIEIIQSTPKESWNGEIDAFGRWHVE